jgi:hypothetical protein
VKTGHNFDLSDGLDDIKIYTRKAYFGTKNIVSLLRDLKSHFSGKLVFAEPGNYKEALAAYVSKYSPECRVTFFLVNDRAINPDTGDVSSKRYYICYDQLYYNDDPLYIFEEDKPGWIAHTTIPHSLARAMINITRPWQNREVHLLDPFGGSGTIFLESVRQSGVTTSSTKDKSEAAVIACRDNIDFFSAEPSKIKAIISDLDPLLNATVSVTSLSSWKGEKSGTMASRRNYPINYGGCIRTLSTFKDYDHLTAEAKPQSPNIRGSTRNLARFLLSGAWNTGTTLMVISFLKEPKPRSALGMRLTSSQKAVTSLLQILPMALIRLWTT